MIHSVPPAQELWHHFKPKIFKLIPCFNTEYIYIHPDVLDFLSGFTFAFFSFSFFKVEEFKFIKSILSVFSDEKSNSYLESIGIRYVNSFRNHTKVLLTLSIFLVIHLIIILPLYKLIKKLNANHRLVKISNYIMNLFMLTLYIRILLEAFLFCFLSIIIEIWVIGFTYSIILLLFWVGFIGVYYAIWMKYCFCSLDRETSYFREFFSGLKESKISSFYFSFFILRRVLCVLSVILLQDCSKYVQVALFSLTNLICLGFSCSIRPFTFIKDNIIEVINDFSFCVFCTQLIYLNSESVWNNTSINFSIYFCLSCCLLTTLINFAFICHELVKWIRERIRKSKEGKIHIESENSALSQISGTQPDGATIISTQYVIDKLIKIHLF